ncbi:hypothetical protein M514_24258 [Trichuris suis]|uniref:Uncharacterized protein n=1 Tax=Trichuris suis TaxID=68888 RepID=A0A085N249_9BILA|nr:hypothetical protein M514_24258 [Trichuris suis]
MECLEHETREAEISKIRNHIYYISNTQCPGLYGLPKIHKPDVCPGTPKDTQTGRPCKVCGFEVCGRHTPLLFYSCYKGFGEKIRRVGKEIGLKIFFKSSASLGSMVRHGKMRLPPEEKAGVVYEVLRSCSTSYIGEMGNSLS